MDVGESVDVSVVKDQSPHTELEVKISDILDGTGTSIMGGGTEYDPRLNAVVQGTKTLIKYEVKNQSAAIVVTIRADPGNSPATSYYPVGIAKMIPGDIVAPGQYTIEWDGRSDFDGRRFLIQGQYKVRLTAICMKCGAKIQYVETAIKVKKPNACLYAYHKFASDIPDAQSRLTSLSDGTQFEIKSSTTATGPSALVEMHEEAALVYCGTHGNAGLILSTDGPPRTGIVSEDFLLAKYFSVQTGGVVADMPEHALDDVFLVVLNACLTAKSPEKAALPASTVLLGLNLPEAMYSKGADTTLGFKEKIPNRAANQWERDFFDQLKQGSSVGDAARVATSNITNPAIQTKLTATIYGNSGARFLPARYGRKKD